MAFEGISRERAAAIVASLRATAVAAERNKQKTHGLTERHLPKFQEACRKRRRLIRTMRMRDAATGAIVGTMRSEVLIHGAPWDDGLHGILPDWLLREGSEYEEGELRPEYRKDPGMQELIADSGGNTLRFFSPRLKSEEGPLLDPRRDASLPADMEWILGVTRVALTSGGATIKALQLWPGRKSGRGLEEVRKHYGPEGFHKYFQMCRCWRPPIGVEHMKFDPDPERRKSFDQLVQLGIVEIRYELRGLEAGNDDDDSDD